MLAGRDIVNEYKNGQALIPVSMNATTNGVGVDCRDCGPEVIAVLNVGAAGGANTTCDVRLEESSDNSTFTNISGATFTQLGNTSSNTLQVIKTAKRSKRYVRAVATMGGGGTAAYCVGVSIHAPKVSY